MTVGLYANTLTQKEKDAEVKCLAQNIYFEARGSSFADQAAVADVVINRVNSSSYPNTICKVVKQGIMSKWWKKVHNKDVPVKNKCQFSWFCDGKSDDVTDIDSWNKARVLAYKVYYNRFYIGLTEGATHYHAHYVNPKWAKKLQMTGTIGSHKFYRKTLR